MNKHLLYSAMLVAAVSANEAKAQDKVTAPDAPVPVQLNLDGKDTVYVYNVKAKMWLNQGNDWGTQANLLEKGGLKLAFVPNKTNGVPNGTVSIYGYSTGQWTSDWSWKRLYYNGKDDNGGTVYVDYGSGSINKCNWEVYLNNEKKTFELQADTIEFKSETTCTRVGMNSKDLNEVKHPQSKFENGQTVRPLLDMSSENKADYGVEWMAVSPEAYDCYMYRKDEMMDIINKAIEAGIDVGNAVTVYNDENSTLAQLKEATQYVKDMTRNKAMEGASSSNIIDITEYIPNADCNSATGWDIVCPDADNDGNVGSGGHGFTWRHGSGTYIVDEDSHECTSFIERWVHKNSKYGSTNKEETDTNNGHLSNSSVSQTLKNLPTGGYKITAYVNACQQGKQEADASYRVDGVYLYAIAGGEEKTVKVATAVGKPEKVTLSVIVDGDTDLSEMTFGMKTDNTTANWVFLDDVTVQYFGSDAMFMAVQAAKDEAAKAADKVGGYSCMLDYQDAVYAIQEQIDNLDATATTQDEVDHLLDQLRSAVADADENVALYEKLTSLSDELTLLTTNADGKYDTKDLQAAYDNCGNGESYDDLCGSYSLNNADLKAYIEKLQTLMVSTRKSAVKEGADCTEDLLTNPTFESATGWNNTGAAINTTYQNAESYQGTFNLYQDITNIPDGVYEITVQAMHRVDNNDNASQLYPNDVNEITACLYGNDITAKFASPYSYGMSEQKVTSGNADYAFNGKYIPNSMEGFSYACEDESAYLTKVYALVTDGKLRVGVKEEARPAGHSSDWAIWDNFRITYKGTGSDALLSCITPLIEQANALLEGKMYEGAKSSLKKAVAAVQSEATMDNIKALSLEIKTAQTAVEAYKPLATAIENVKARYESNETTATTSAEAKAIYNASLKTAEDAYNNGTVAEENIEAAIKELNKGYTQYFIYDVVAAAENGASVDISKVINNYDFATMDKTGWTIKVTQNAAGFQKDKNIKAVEFYDNKGFDLYQELVGMPAGTYKLSARAYYRLKSSGNIDDVVNAFVYYANSKEADAEPVAKADVKSIYAGAITKDELGKVNLTSTDGMSPYNGSYYVPNDMTTGQRFLTSEEIGPKYDSDVITFDYDGTSPFYIGVANTNKEKGNDWTFVKSFKLSYVKGTTGIENINGEKAGDVVSTKIYDINGVQYNSLKPGVNIVKSVMSDGSVKVRKVVVK